MEKFKLKHWGDDGIAIYRSVDGGELWKQVAYVNTGAGGSTATLARDIVVMMNILAYHRLNHCPGTFGLYQTMDCTENSEDGYSDECDKCWENAFEKATGEEGE